MSKQLFNGVVSAELHTIKLSIGGVGVAGCDFNFASALNMNEQSIDLGAVIPAYGRVIDIFSVTNNQFTGAVTLSTDVGAAAGTAEYIVAADIFAAGAVLPAAAASAPLIAPAAGASHIFVNSTPGANWNLVIAGKMTIYITYIDISHL